MDTKEILKKYWFVGVVGLAMLVFLCAYCVDAISNREVKIKTKTVDGAYAVLSVGDDYLTADELYESLFDGYGLAAAFNSYSRVVIDKAIPTTEDISTYVANYSYYISQNNSKESVDSALREYGYNGYDDLDSYCMTIVKQQELMNQFYEKNYAEYIQPVIDKEQPMEILHILIKVADVKQVMDEEGNVVGHVANPTAEEQKKLDEVLDMLANEDFSDVAMLYSEDPGSAANGGSLGVNFKSTLENYVLEFKNACMDLKPGEVTDVITTEYGWHIITAKEADTSDLLQNTDFLQLIDKTFPNLTVKAIVDKGEELGFTIVSEDLKNEIASLLEGE